MRLPVSLPLVIMFAGISLVSFPQASHAFTAADNDTRIDINGIDIAPTSTPIPTIALRRSPTPKIALPAKLPSSVKQGDPIEAERKFFSFAISATDLDFGTIDVTNPVIRTHRLTLDPGSAVSYTLFAYENRPLQLTDASAFIPDTTCDDGNCTESIPSLWQNTLTYGLGVRCDQETEHKTCDADFSDPQMYKQFADLTKKEPGTTLLSGRGDEVTEARATYKVNVPGTQKPGIYRNALVFIAAPGY